MFRAFASTGLDYEQRIFSGQVFYPSKITRAYIDPCYPLGYRAERFPRNRICLLAKFACGNLFVLIFSNQHNAVSDLRFNTFGHIYDSLIHSDTTNNRASLSMDKDITTIT